ncbi:MAG: DUF2202 domain-containing protein [Desulfonatronovibrio sp.]
MKKQFLATQIILVVMLLFYGAGAYAWQGGQGNSKQNIPGGPGTGISQPTAELTADEILAFEHILEEEKLARDVYLALSEIWDISIFEYIAASEEQHIRAMVNLGRRYGQDISATQNAPGVFNNQEFQNYYNDLIDMGMSSPEEALSAGVLVEELDIFDIQVSLLLIENEEFKTVLQNLLKGSRNHLRSFYATLLAAGGNYSPEFLTQQQFDEIVNSPMERGRVDQDGNPADSGGRGFNRGNEDHRGNQGQCDNGECMFF